MTDAKAIKLPELDEDKKFRDRKALYFSFLAPLAGMFFIYCFLGVYPAGNNSVLVLDLNAQYIYYFEQLRSILTEGKSIIYTFERAAGGEFMGMFAYYLSSPFSLLVALFPKQSITEAMLFILVLKTGCAGLSFSYLLTKKRDMGIIPRVMFSTMYALSSYVVVLQHNVMWMDNVIVFPLLLLAVDELISKGKFKLYVIALVYSVMSNFYLGYMTCLFIFIWFFVRYFMLSQEERNPKNIKLHFLKSLVRIGLFSLLAVMISAIIILPVYYSLGFGKLEFSTPNFTPKQLFDFADLLTKAFFGSYDSVRPSGMPFYYCGTLSLILAPLYFFCDKIPTRKKVGMAVIMLVLVASFNFSVLDIIWHGMQRPNWLNARFAYMFTALMVLMAADVFNNIKSIGAKAFTCSAVAWCALLVILAKIGYDNLPDFRCVWAGILLFVLFSAVMPSYIRSLDSDSVKKTSAGVLCGIVLAEALGNGVVMLYALDEDVAYSRRSSYRQMIDTYEEAADTFLDNTGDEFYRAEKLVHRKKNDNFALGIRGMSNSTSTLNARTIKLLSQFGYASMSHWSMYAGATAVTDALFDIKYVMADETDDKPVMNYIHDLYELYDSTDDDIDIYENPYALSIAYSVNADALDYDKPKGEMYVDDGYVDPFTYMNELLSKMVGHDVTVWSKVNVKKTTETGCSVTFATGHRGFEKDGDGTAKVTYILDIDSDKAVYAYFPSEYPRDAELKLNGKKLCTYFDGEDFSIRELGKFYIGEEEKVELVMKEKQMYIRSGCSYFWYFDEDAFVSAISELKDGTMDAHSKKDDRIYGKITVPDGDGAVFTTIPCDDGWKVYVDGEEVEKKAVLNESLIAFDITPGEHELVFEYRPDCVKYGLILSVSGLVIFAVLCVGEYVLKKKRASREIIEEDVEVIPDEEVFGEISEETSGDASNESAIEPAEDTVKEDKTE